jgi:CBS domain-containing protein
MTEARIGSIAVRENGRVVGILTERDLVARVLADDAPSDLPIRRAMRTDVPTVTPASTDAECTALMRDHTTRHLLVVDGGEVVGVVSMRDLIRLMLAEKEWLIDQLHTFIDGHDRPHAIASP